jgi:hypothetical protein
MPVGAVAAYLVALTAQTSLRTGVFAALGVATADGVYALIALCGGAALASVLRPVTLPLRRGSAVVLGRQAAAAPGRAGQAVFVVAVFVASASWQLVLAGGGAFLGRVLTGSRGRLITAMASSILIGGLALHLLIAAS